MYIKNFEDWSFVKKRLDTEDRKVSIRSGEIRWMSIGINVGSEIDGKGVSFTRPGLIVHVIGSSLALVIPLTTKLKNIPGYFTFSLKDGAVSLCIHQIRILSQKRIFGRKGRISERRLFEVKNTVKDFFAF